MAHKQGAKMAVCLEDRERPGADPSTQTRDPVKERAMQQLTQIDQERSGERQLVHEWQADQLRQLGLSWALAFTFAPLVDWHEVAGLVERGCPPLVAVEIVR
jgi:hypothetical protein